MVTESVGLQQSSTKISEEDYIRQFVYFPILDKVMSELQHRFSTENMAILCGIYALSPKNNNFLEFDTLTPLASHYKSNLEDLEIELRQLNRLVKRKKEKDDFNAETLLEMIFFVNKYEDAFYEIKRLLYIACSICVTSVEAERSFSTLKLIKTHLRSTMADDRLSNITIISIHKKGQKTEFRPCS